MKNYSVNHVTHGQIIDFDHFLLDILQLVSKKM